LKIIKTLILLTVLFSGSLMAFDDDIRCEPSVIFPEVFFLESPGCFSFDTANTVYSDGTESLKKYLDMFENSEEGNIYRYLYYLRRQENLPALMVLMLMTSNGLIKGSESLFYNEFNNLIIGGIKESESSGDNKKLHLSSGSAPVSVKDLSTNFFSALSYIAAYVMEEKSSKNIDGEILVRSFHYIISNIQGGIDWDDDIYINDLFNSFVIMKNQGLLKSFADIFYFYLRGDKNIPPFNDYVKLREIGMVKDMRPFPAGDSAVQRERKVFASFFLENINNVDRIVFTSDFSDIVNADNSKTCDYLNKRGAWLEKLKDYDPADTVFNESVKIVEQCPDSFHLPFKIERGAVKVYSGSKWITDLAFAVSYIIKEDLPDDESKIIIEGALRSSLGKNSETADKKLAEDVLSYLRETGKAEMFIKALFARKIEGKKGNGNKDPITEAAEIIAEILF
jgi:hypothetical protein